MPQVGAEWKPLGTVKLKHYPLEGNGGTVNFNHCTFSWEYDVAAQKLTIQCVGKPFFVTCQTITDKLNGLFYGPDGG